MANLLDRMLGPRERSGRRPIGISTVPTSAPPTTKAPIPPTVPVAEQTGNAYDGKVDTWRPWVQKNYVSEFGLKPGMRLLDVGCGDGFWAMLLAEHGLQVTGVDLADGALEAARLRLPDATFVLADVKDPLPFDPESFDVAFLRGFSMFGLPTIDGDAVDRQLTNVAQVMRPGGVLLVSSYSTLSGVPSAGSMWVNHRVSTIVAAVEKVADPFKVVRAGNYVQVGAHRRPEV